MADPCGPQLTLHTSRRAHIRVSEWKLFGVRVRRQALQGAFELPSEEPACAPLSSPAAPRVSKAPARPVMVGAQAAATGYDSTSTLMILTPWILAPVVGLLFHSRVRLLPFGKSLRSLTAIVTSSDVLGFLPLRDNLL